MEQKEMIQNLRMMLAELQESEGIVNAQLFRAMRYTKYSREDFPPIVLRHWIGDCEYFKNKKPLAVIFNEEHRAEVMTWKETALVLMQDCDTEFHDQLTYMCGKVYGKQRVLLTGKPDELQVPIEIGEGVYMEAKFDTASLLHVVRRIYYAVGYDFGDIQIECQM